MKTRTIRIILWGTAGGFLWATISSVAIAYLLPYEEVPTQTARSSDPSHTTAAIENQSPDLAQFTKAWSLHLQRPLYDSPAPNTPTSPAKQPKVLSARLAGTVVEPGHSVAMFVSGGKIELKGIGDKIDQAEVLTITSTGVSLRHRGKEIDLKLENTNKH